MIKNEKNHKNCESTYFKLPQQPCSCSEIPYYVKKAVKTLLDSSIPISDMTIYTLWDAFPVSLSDSTPNIAIFGNMLNVEVVGGENLSIPLSNVITIGFEAAGNVTAFMNYLNKEYPKKDLGLRFFEDQNLFDYVYQFNINADLSDGGLHIQGSIINYDCEIAWIRAYECDYYTNEFYFIQLSAIDSVQKLD